MSIKPETINVTLSLSDAENHQGNTGAGNYYYSYSEEFIYVDKKDQKIQFDLQDETQKKFKIISLLVTDPSSQITDIVIAQDGQSVSCVDLNTAAALIPATILLQEINGKKIISCDPQVGNRPPT